MKIKNGSSAMVLGLGVFIAATTAQASAQDVIQKAITNPGNTNQEAQSQAAIIHEETINVDFDNTGVSNTVASLADIDKNAIPNC